MPEDTFDATPALLGNEASVENRTEIKVINKQLELLELDRKAKKAEYYPTLALSGNFGYTGVGQKFPWVSKDEHTFYYSAASIGLSLNIPVFNGFSTRAKLRQADVNIRKAEVEKREAELAISLDIENAKTQINNSLITINTQKENVDFALWFFNNL